MSFFGLFGPPDVEKLKTKGNIQGLIKALNYKEDNAVPKAAAKALGQLGNAQTVKALIVAFKDIDSNVFSDISEALTKIDPNWKKNDQAQQLVLDMIEALSHADQDKQITAARVLGHLGDTRAVDPLISALSKLTQKDETKTSKPRASLDASAFRTEIFRALGMLGDKRAIGPLIDSLNECSFSAFHSESIALAETLAKLSDVQLVDVLIEILHNNSFNAHVAAAALGKIGDTRAVQPLIKRLPDPTAYAKALKDAPNVFASLVSRQLVETDVIALGEIGDVRALVPLIKFIKAEYTISLSVVMESLGKIDPNWMKSEQARQAIPYLVTKLTSTSNIYDERDGVIKALTLIDPKQLQSKDEPSKEHFFEDGKLILEAENFLLIEIEIPPGYIMLLRQALVEQVVSKTEFSFEQAATMTAGQLFAARNGGVTQDEMIRVGAQISQKSWVFQYPRISSAIEMKGLSSNWEVPVVVVAWQN